MKFYSTNLASFIEAFLVGVILGKPCLVKLTLVTEIALFFCSLQNCVALIFLQCNENTRWK